MHTLIDLFHTFQARGKKTVFVYRTGVRRLTYSYQWLFEQSLKMASWLKQRGVEKGDRVVIWAPNSPWWAVAFWGAIARGALVVPVDFMSGRDRAEKIMRLTQAKVILQSQYKIDKIREQGTGNGEQKSELVENLEYLLPGLSANDSPRIASPDDIAELIYTSGTTGDPKGVILTHRNLVSNLLQVNEHIPVVRENWNFLSVLPLSHTFEQMAGFLTPLFRGGKIVYMRTLKPSAIMGALAEEDIYAFPLVPRLLQALKTSIERELDAKHLGGVFRWLLRRVGEDSASAPGRRQAPLLLKRKKYFFPIHHKFGRHFQFFISGGAALPRDVAEFWRGMGFRVIEGYGITECSPVLTANTFERQVMGSVGKPLPGVEIKIDTKNTPPHSSPPYGGGVKGRLEGEILAKGPNVFPGYYQNEEATKKAFTDDGFFRTGDMGFCDAEGNLFIKGRQKEMIVTGAGVNVYPDDLEPILLSLPGVKDACVIGKSTPEGEEVHAVLILADQPGGDADHSGERQGQSVFNQREFALAKSIIESANSQLDTLQQITGFTLWPEKEFPKTSTMKIQKFKVKQVVESMGNSDLRPLPSTDKLLSLIASVTGKPLNEISETSVLVSDLGLTSIARLELVNAIEQEFRLDMEDTAITQTTTVAELRTMIERREKVQGKIKSRLWVHTPFGRLIQYLMDNLFNWHLLKLFVKLKVEGLEQFENLQGPAIFIGNHVSYLDGPCVYASLPSRWRYRLASAAGAFLFFESNKSLFKRIVGRIYFEYMTLLCGAFLVTQDGGGFQKSLMFMGELIDRNVSLLFFPEGSRSYDGILQPFQKGLGLLVKELKVPVIPFRLLGTEKLMPRGAIFPKRGSVTIRYGKPMTFGLETPSEILEKARKAIEAL